MSNVAEAPVRRGIRWGAVLTLVLFAIAGGVLGYLAYRSVFGGPEAIALIQIGQVGGDSAPILVEDPNTLMERMKSADFADAVAKRSGLADAAKLLPAGQYGGAGALRSRMLRSGDQVEIRVTAEGEDEAMALAGAVLDEIGAEHDALMAPLMAVLNAQIADMEAQAASVRAADTEVGTRLSAIDLSQRSLVEYSMLLSARAANAAQLLDVAESITDARMLALPPQTEPTRVIARPSISRPVLSSPFHTGVLGAVAGFLVGLLALMSRRLITG